MIGKINEEKIKCLAFHREILETERLRLKDVLEDVFKASVVGLEDGVLSAHVQWPFLLNGILETAVSKPTNGLHEKIPKTG